MTVTAQNKTMIWNILKHHGNNNNNLYILHVAIKWTFSF